MCGDQLEAKHFELQQFCTLHIKEYFNQQHFMVKRRIADAVKSWTAEILNEDFSDWAYGKY